MGGARRRVARRGAGRRRPGAAARRRGAARAGGGRALLQEGAARPWLQWQVATAAARRPARHQRRGAEMRAAALPSAAPDPSVPVSWRATRSLDPKGRSASGERRAPGCRRGVVSDTAAESGAVGTGAGGCSGTHCIGRNQAHMLSRDGCDRSGGGHRSEEALQKACAISSGQGSGSHQSGRNLSFPLSRCPTHVGWSPKAAGCEWQ